MAAAASAAAAYYTEHDLSADCVLLLDGDGDAQQWAARVVDPAVRECVDDLRYLESMDAALRIERALCERAVSSSSSSGSGSVSNVASTQVSRKRFSVQHLADALPVCMVCSELNGTTSSNNSGEGSRDASLKQLRRDVERDKLKINGRRVVGSEAGLDGVLAATVAALQDAMRTSRLPPLDGDAAHALAVEVLRWASRTNSGFLCYSAVQALLVDGSDGATTLITPLSTLAKPIAVDVRVGGASAGHGGWGLACTVTCSSFFNVSSSSDNVTSNSSGSGSGGGSSVVLEGVYRHSLLLPVDVAGTVSARNLSGLAGNTLDAATVTVQRRQ
jgi:hypothetical protein